MNTGRVRIEYLPDDTCTTEFHCLGCRAPLAVRHRLPEDLHHERTTCVYCGDKYLLPMPGEILYEQKLGNYAYLGMSNGDVYVSRDNGVTWEERHTFPAHPPIKVTK